MNEKLNNLRNTCSAIGVAFLLLYIFLCIGGIIRISGIFLVMRVITAVIALTAYSIKCGAEVISDEKFGNTIFFMSFCLFDIIFTAIQLI